MKYGWHYTSPKRLKPALTKMWSVSLPFPLIYISFQLCGYFTWNIIIKMFGKSERQLTERKKDEKYL
jgi:hypothetical protein